MNCKKLIKERYNNYKHSLRLTFSLAQGLQPFKFFYNSIIKEVGVLDV